MVTFTASPLFSRNSTQGKGHIVTILTTSEVSEIQPAPEKINIELE